MLRTALLTSALLLATAPRAPAGSSYLTATALYDFCTSPEDWDKQVCMNYIMGVSDAIDLLQGRDSNRTQAPLICSPSLSGKQLADIIVSYLKNANNRRYSAAEAVEFALEA